MIQSAMLSCFVGSAAASMRYLPDGHSLQMTDGLEYSSWYFPARQMVQSDVRPAEYQQFIAVAISSLCGHGTILDAATNKCVLSYQNFIDRCRSEPHLSTCGNHKDESAAQCGGTPGSPGSTHSEPGNDRNASGGATITNV